MRRYTLEDFKTFEKDEYGVLICPQGDYTSLKNIPASCSFGEGCSFGEWCSFGKRCSFGEECSFGKWCSFGEGCSFGEECSFGEGMQFRRGCECEFGKFQKMLSAGGFGREGRTTYFFRCTDGIYVRCGCFAGTLDEWAERIQKTHRGSVYGRGYLALIPAVKIMMEGEKEHEEKCV
ncbi:hypothetical protein [Anaerotignum lactatifermentans]|uniref:hypothetical protein n=1 Tax=Anaerotignum lactatifermentans TaxID=160404 RepID=UPI003AB34BF8